MTLQDRQKRLIQLVEEIETSLLEQGLSREERRSKLLRLAVAVRRIAFACFEEDARKPLSPQAVAEGKQLIERALLEVKDRKLVCHVIDSIYTGNDPTKLPV